MNNSSPILYLVVPCYNEEQVLKMTYDALSEQYSLWCTQGIIDLKSKILMVNDGSKDATWDIICKLADKDNRVCGVNLSRNRGHQVAVLAGLMKAKEYADVIISIDADLQQDIHAVELMINKFNEGFDIVYGVRNNRSSDGLFKKVSALGFYGLMNSMGCNVIKNHADYRMMSKRAVECLAEYNETNLFLRGLIPEIGFESDVVYFDVTERKAGESKYTLKKMIAFAIDGITSFSRVLQLGKIKTL